jgi:hypothetical protein
MYFTLTSVLPYFEGFKLAQFNVIIVPRTTFDFELDARISQRSYIDLGDVFKHFMLLFPIFHRAVSLVSPRVIGVSRLDILRLL